MSEFSNTDVSKHATGCSDGHALTHHDLTIYLQAPLCLLCALMCTELYAGGSTEMAGKENADGDNGKSQPAKAEQKGPKKSRKAATAKAFALPNAVLASL